MLALTAGGASGLTAISRELGGDDRVVAVVQYLRVGIVTGTLPLVAAMASAPGSAPVRRRRLVRARLRLSGGRRPRHRGPGPAGPAAVRPGGGAASAVSAGSRLPRLLGPLAVTTALAVLGTGVDTTSGPLVVATAVAYAVIGWQAGTRFTPESVRTVARSLPIAAALILAVIACAQASACS